MVCAIRDGAVLGTWPVRRGERRLHSRLPRTLAEMRRWRRKHRVPFRLVDRLCVVCFVGWLRDLCSMLDTTLLVLATADFWGSKEVLWGEAKQQKDLVERVACFVVNMDPTVK